jgi:hypothetical protein
LYFEKHNAEQDYLSYKFKLVTAELASFSPAGHAYLLCGLVYRTLSVNGFKQASLSLAEYRLPIYLDPEL